MVPLKGEEARQLLAARLQHRTFDLAKGQRFAGHEHCGRTVVRGVHRMVDDFTGKPFVCGSCHRRIAEVASDGTVTMVAIEREATA